MRRLLAAAGLILCAASAPVAAHHSLAPFIQTKAEIVSGRVKEFAWTNPHTRLVLIVTDERGNTAELVFEGVSTSRLATAGFKKDTMMPGDPISVAYNPRRDGTPGGMFVAVTLYSGVTLRLDRYQLLRGGGQRIE